MTSFLILTEVALEVDGKDNSDGENSNGGHVDEEIALEAEVLHSVPPRLLKDVVISGRKWRRD